MSMGHDVAREFPAARRVFTAVNEALGFELSGLMWEGPEDELTLTHNAQPAILAHTLAVKAVVDSALSIKAAAGHSLGEYSAYQAAGSLELADAARLVRRRGELMLEAGRRRPGTMTAVLGIATDQVEDLCSQSSIGGELVVAANINAPDQTVISGDPDAVRAAEAKCREAGAKRVLPLKVSGAFHSPLMQPAEVGLRDELSRVAFADPRFPVIANASGEPVAGAEQARQMLGAQLTSPIRWVQSMRSAAEQTGAAARFVELGPGKVLCGLLRRIVPEAKSVSLDRAVDINRFLEEAA